MKLSGRFLQFSAIAIVVVLTFPVEAREDASTSLSPFYYYKSCPKLESTVRSGLQTVMKSNSRAGASILRLHFHDCFVQGCDGSVLLNDTSTFTGEKTATLNGGLRGFNEFDDIKALVESVCEATVSCADLLAIAAREAVVAAGGPSWTVEYGRRDSRTASLSLANSNLPSPNSDVASLTNKFSAAGLTEVDMVTLTGAHTIGRSQCGAFSNRLYNPNGTGKPDPTIDASFLAIFQSKCPQNGAGNVLVDLDQSTPTTFDNAFYSNLLSNKGVLTSDQTLESECGSTAGSVKDYGSRQEEFFAQFADSMIKMGRINPLTGSTGEVRTDCRFVNSRD